ncbi:Glyoxalase/Bleomycin resistance protein/Dihydroxybiphenyl dioxygenase [Halenospora varia]|nr:Glyoxalase/Bleomycin resistance protein/Dihydroxybiphenyl dioxygenase [Halenospora varia]
MAISHISLPVTSLPTSKTFYTTLLSHLGYAVFLELPETISFGQKYKGPDFWLHCCPEKAKEREEEGKNGGKGDGEGKEKEMKKTGVHVAFEANSKWDVDTFYSTALKAGATCNGPPGERPQYTTNYYAAYILDPDGNNIECVWYHPLWLRAMKVLPKVAVVGAGVLIAYFWGRVKVCEGRKELDGW